ncbi:MAG: 4-hydroxy-3-methylbut-2-enyl diphosphate reductase [Bacteroidales bacterium]
MEIIIDPDSGFCFGVRRAIQLAEDNLSDGPLTCLGDMVHNEAEVARLEALGMQTFRPSRDNKWPGGRVLIRAHGEPPETYARLRDSGAQVIDATCPIVLRLQEKVKKAFEASRQTGSQILIYGKQGHPEVMGLNGQTGYRALVISDESDFDAIDFDKSAELFSQTTMDAESYTRLAEKLRIRFTAKGQTLKVHPSSCRQVSGRVEGLRKFAVSVDVVVFVSGRHSSNGKALFEVCRAVNARTYHVSAPSELDPAWFSGAQRCGISGATSTPPWLLEQVAHAIRTLTS